MATIKHIDHGTIHKIQSGQVIVDLCSVVKELVENSIDAGASILEVRFRNQGLDQIEVQDNGSGVTPANYETIALKHHTSKLSTYDDIARLDTFGFRGEALASLCALSDLQITTCTADDAPKGCALTFEASGHLKDKRVVASQKGTTVSVEKLFHNLPVRRRELEHNIKREWHKVITLLNQYACIQTGLKFTVSQHPSRGKRVVLFATQGNTTVRENIINIFGAKTITSLIPLDLSLELQSNGPTIEQHVVVPDGHKGNEEVQISGFVSRPLNGEGRQAPDRQMFFVNGRPCGLPQFAKTFNEVYRGYNVAQSPFVCADIQLNTAAYDVNVSPDKRTVMLHDQHRLLNALRSSLVALYDKYDHMVPVAVPSSSGHRTKSAAVSSGVSKGYSQSTAFDSPLRTRPDGQLSMAMTASSEDESQTGRGDKVNAQRRLSGSKVQNNRSSPTLSPETQKLRSPRAQDSEVGTCPPQTSPASQPAWSLASSTDEASIPARPSSRSPSQKAIPFKRPSSQDLERSGADQQSRKARRLGQQNLKEAEQTSGVNRLAHFECQTTGSNRTETPPSHRKFTAPGFSAPTSVELRSPVGSVALHEDERTTTKPAALTVHSAEQRGSTSFDDENGESVASEDDGPQAEPGDPASDSDIELSETEEVIDSQAQSLYVRASAPTLGEDGFFTPAKRDRRRETTAGLQCRIQIRECDVASMIASTSEADCAHLDFASSPVDISDIAAADAETKLALVITRSDFATMRVVGQFNLGFVIAVRPAVRRKDDTSHDELFIVDQHASDEKYNFERLYAETKLQSQRMVQQRRLDLTALEEEIILNNIEAIEANGFEIDVDTSGERTVGARCLLKAMPLSREITFGVKDLEELVAVLSDSPTGLTHLPRPSKVRKMLAMRACRSSVMVGKALVRRQMYDLVRHMGEMDKPWNCPHGRPTMRHLCRLQGLDEGRWQSDVVPEESAMWKAFAEL